ncbi:MAG TPA: hypothetical protein VFG86_21975 [Chloroflexota bacterium]|nr:hypothetical protein [Chloroflexota bacterium]
MALGWRTDGTKRTDSLPIAAPGWRSGCPVCGYHDKVRQLDAVYQDRERTRAEQPPLVNRFGLMVRGHPMLSNLPRVPSRLTPPRRPSAVATYIGTGGPHFAMLIGIPAVAALLIRPDTWAQFLMSLLVATLLGATSRPVSERAQKVWHKRTAEWEQAMRAWRELRYCSRCDQIFVARS